MANPQEGETSRLDLVELNISQLGILTFEKTRDLREKIEVIENLTVLQAPDDAFVRLAMLRLRTQEALEKLPQKQATISNIIRTYEITDQIDTVFLEEMLMLSERHISTPVDQRDETFYEQEKEVVSNVLKSLQTRKAKEVQERSLEKGYEVEISGDRVCKLFVSPDKDTVRMELPVVIDPNLNKVRIGSKAVVEILGAKLTHEDYQKIAETMLSFEGTVGKIMRAYANAIDIYTDLYANGQNTSSARFSRMMRAQEIRRAFGGEDPRIAPFCDIPLNAITMYVRANYPEVDQTVPQPFES
ncbi:MAG: hypothetical protein Q8P25_04240 [Candidatus Curtissbacteria bacterium]|nr:hypothetical protein [Candidatus Curtissbacteria bacterium]